MSAWMTSQIHRDLIVKAHAQHNEDVNKNALAQALFLENRRSLHARYNDPLPTDAEVAAIEYSDPAPGFHVTDRGAAALAACYDYQSCEHVEWGHSDVKKHVIVPLHALAPETWNKPEGDSPRLPWGAERDNVAAFVEADEESAPTFTFTVTIQAKNRFLAEAALAERLDYDEQYYVTGPFGEVSTEPLNDESEPFDYRIMGWTEAAA